MTFKENLLRKIEIDGLTRQVLATLGPPGSEKKVDRDAMRRLLDMGGYTFQRERDLDLYIAPDDGRVLVLDNELAVYSTTPEDIALRRSPTVKEMISIRNVVRILNDKDVVVSKREESVRTVSRKCLHALDLSFGPEDIDEIRTDGAVALEVGDGNGVMETIALFGEILGFVPPPPVLRIPKYEITGESTEKEPGKVYYGPMVIYSRVHNRLLLMEEPIPTHDKEKVASVQAVAAGGEKPHAEGAAVFDFLKDRALDLSPRRVPVKD